MDEAHQYGLLFQKLALACLILCKSPAAIAAKGLAFAKLRNPLGSSEKIRDVHKS